MHIWFTVCVYILNAHMHCYQHVFRSLILVCVCVCTCTGYIYLVTDAVAGLVGVVGPVHLAVGLGLGQH